jgi:hypothetical protein
VKIVKIVEIKAIPLHPIKTSIPMTCQETGRQCQDILMHLLYSGGSEVLLRSLITQSIRNITDEFGGSKGVRDALAHYILPPACSLALLRAVFFILLNQDSRMRSNLCKQRYLPSLPTVCPHKACILYDQLHDVVIVEWVKRESIDLMQFEESLKEAYLVS